MIAVIGEALIDFVVNQDGAVAARPGGGPYNTARTLGRLGQPAMFAGRLSDDTFGRILGQHLAEDHVPLGVPAPSQAPSTLAAAAIPKVRVVDTIGAGDAFGGAFLAWWAASGLTKGDLKRADMVQHALRAAAQVAALTCARAGAEPPWLAEVATTPCILPAT